MLRTMSCVTLSAMVANASLASTPVQVEITGTVEFNQITVGELEEVMDGAPVSLTFMVHATSFVESVNFPTRGYIIDANSFNLQIGGVSVGLQNPFPVGQSPLFVIRDNDPAVDGFYISTDVDFPVGVPTDETGLITQFMNNFSVTYLMDPLPSLDILDALGTYDFTNISSFNWALDDGPFQAMFILFAQLEISLPPCIGDIDGCGVVNGFDLASLLSNWGPCVPGQPCLGDLNGDGVVNGADLATLLANWGPCAI